MPLIGLETPRFAPLPAAQRYGPPLPDLFDAATRRKPVTWAAAALVLAAALALQWPASPWLDWLARHGVLPMPLCSAPRWSLADAATVLAMWCAMLAVMGASNVAIRLHTALRAPTDTRPAWWRLLLNCCADGAPAAFAWGHVMTALAVAVLLTLLNGALARAGLIGTDTALIARWAGPWLIVLGFWQALPWQPGFELRALQKPVAAPGLPIAVLLGRGWRYGWRMAATELPPLLALFALGIMNLGWMALHMVLSAARQRWPRQRLVLTRLLGLFWFTMGVALAMAA